MHLDVAEISITNPTTQLFLRQGRRISGVASTSIIFTSLSRPTAKLNSPQTTSCEGKIETFKTRRALGESESENIGRWWKRVLARLMGRMTALVLQARANNMQWSIIRIYV